MALDGNRLGVAIAAAILASAPSDDAPVSESALEAIWIAVGEEIVTEFTANGVVATPDTFVGTIS